MKQVLLYLQRLKKPSIFFTLAAQLFSFGLFLIGQETLALITVAPPAFALFLSLMGILSDPDAEKKGFGDDFAYCKHCGVKTRYVNIAGKRYCRICGTIHEDTESSSALIL